MTLGLTDIYGGVLVGLCATLFMDLGTQVSKIVFGTVAPNYCLVGRWLRHMPATFRHSSISDAPKKHLECLTGWVFHYFTGVVYALLLVVSISAEWLRQPTILPAMIVGVGTLVIPFFVMQPCFGLGIAAARSPSPARARLRSLSAHVLFGIGLYLSALAISQFGVPAR